MGFDVESHLGAVERSVSSLERDGQPARAVTLVRSYATTVEDVWDAVTNGERIPRWLLSISGLLELGGRALSVGRGREEAEALAGKVAVKSERLPDAVAGLIGVEEGQHGGGIDEQLHESNASSR